MLWGEKPPRSAQKTLQTYILHLRRFLGARLVTRPPGYMLDVPPESVDAIAFERDVGAGRLALLRGDAAEGVARLYDAAARWRGRPYEGFDHPMFVAESVRLEELRLGSIEDALEARLDFDEPAVLVPELPAVQVPALVLHLADSLTGATNARWLAEHLRDATYLELPGWYLPTADEARAVGDAVVDFVRRPDERR